MTRNRVSELDLLRFFAALSVVLFHYSFRGYAADSLSVMPYPILAPIAKYGYFGVNLFFMISGFVILMTAASGSLRGFLISRFVRLYPAFWACCTISFTAILVFGGSKFQASVSQYLINMTMLSGFVGVSSIDGIYWSLFVEVQFYALVAAVLFIKRIHQAQYFLVVWLLASVALEILPIGKLRYLLIADYSAYFISGSMCFLVWSQGFSLTRISAIIVSWGLSICQSLKELPHLEKYYNTGMDGYVVVGIITSFFLVMFLVATRRTGFLWRNDWVMIGALTYPLYLLHQTIGFMIFNIAYPTINPHLLLWGTIILMLGAAYAVVVLIERKFSLPIEDAMNHLFDFIHRRIG